MTEPTSLKCVIDKLYDLLDNRISKINAHPRLDIKNTTDSINLNEELQYLSVLRGLLVMIDDFTCEPTTVDDLTGREKYLYNMGRLIGMNDLADSANKIYKDMLYPLGVELDKYKSDVFGGIDE